jgi:hypothetical protein
MRNQTPDKRGRRIGTWLGIASILASGAAFGAFVLYATWHWDLVRLQRAGEPVADWRWRIVDSLKLVNVVLALVAIILLLLAVRRRAWIAGLFALAAAVLCLWTVPLVT